MLGTTSASPADLQVLLFSKAGIKQCNSVLFGSDLLGVVLVVACK